MTAEQRAAMEKAYKEALAIPQRQEEEGEEQGGRGKRARIPRHTQSRTEDSGRLVLL